jgi:hypothetical protein
MGFVGLVVADVDVFDAFYIHFYVFLVILHRTEVHTLGQLLEV